MTEIAIILLAAGGSSRMGQSKQLLLIEDEPLLLRSVKAALAAGQKQVVVVLGANEKKHEEVIQDLPVIIVYNKNWEKGMGNSLKTGLQRVLAFAPDMDAAIIAVCDQPRLDSQHFKKLVAAYSETKCKIVTSYYAKTEGVPALFDKTLFQELLSLDDRQGAKKIITQFPGLAIHVDFPGGEIDLDTMTDYNTFISNP